MQPFFSTAQTLIVYPKHTWRLILHPQFLLKRHNLFREANLWQMSSISVAMTNTSNTPKAAQNWAGSWKEREVSASGTKDDPEYGIGPSHPHQCPNQTISCPRPATHPCHPHDPDETKEANTPSEPKMMNHGNLPSTTARSSTAITTTMLLWAIASPTRSWSEP